MNRPIFGQRVAVEVAGRLRDPKILATVRECIAKCQPQWTWPIQLRRYEEADVRAAVEFLEREKEG